MMMGAYKLAVDEASLLASGASLGSSENHRQVGFRMIAV
jgi:hypothetical protein